MVKRSWPDTSAGAQRRAAEPPELCLRDAWPPAPLPLAAPLLFELLLLSFAPPDGAAADPERCDDCEDCWGLVLVVMREGRANAVPRLEGRRRCAAQPLQTLLDGLRGVVVFLNGRRQRADQRVKLGRVGRRVELVEQLEGVCVARDLEPDVRLVEVGVGRAAQQRDVGVTLV